MTFKVLTTKPFINGELDQSLIREDRLYQEKRKVQKTIREDYWDFKSDIILLPCTFTMEDMISSATKNLEGKDLENYLFNLNQCQLIEVELTLV